MKQDEECLIHQVGVQLKSSELYGRVLDGQLLLAYTTKTNTHILK